MIDTAAYNKLVRDTINSVIGVSNFAIEAQAIGPRPVGPYATVQLLDIESIGWEEFTGTNSGGSSVKQTTELNYYLLFRVEFFRHSALSNCHKFKAGLSRETVLSTLHASKAALGIRGTVLNLREEIKGTWEERAQFTFNLHVVGTDSEVLNAIDTINLDAQYENVESINVSIGV